MRWLAAAALIASALSPILAEGGSLTLLGVGGGAASAAYTGPGDVVSGALAWWGMRAYSRAKAQANANAYRLTRSSDGVQQDITLLNNGNSDITTATTFCASTTCQVNIFYDQTGNGNDVQGGTNTFTFNCVNTSLPCITAAGTVGGYVKTSVSASASQPITGSAFAKRVGSFTTAQNIISGFHNTTNTTGPAMQFGAATGIVTLYSGSSLTATATNSAWHALNFLFSGVNSVINVDGTETTGAGGAGGITNTVGIAFDRSVSTVGGTNPILSSGTFTEGGFWAAGFTSGQRQSMCNNQSSYYLGTTPC